MSAVRAAAILWWRRHQTRHIDRVLAKHGDRMRATQDELTELHRVADLLGLPMPVEPFRAVHGVICHSAWRSGGRSS